MTFPKYFLFGVATSSHQIEGNTQNNWTQWEHSMTRIKHLQKEGKDPEKYFSGNASFHFEKMEEDVSTMEELNIETYRFSIEWSRIQPKEHEVCQEGIAFYDRLLTLLRKKNITPFITLWHWNIPIWLEEKGGILSSKFPHFFQKYTDILLPLLQKHKVEHIITFNEPMVFSGAAYKEGRWPPQKCSTFLFLKALWNIIRAHKKVYLKLHTLYEKKNLPIQVGVAKHSIYFHTEGKKVTDTLRVFFTRYFWNECFLDRIKNHQDFIGINYYFRNKIENGVSCNPNKKCSDMGWELYPQGLANICEEIFKKYKKKIYITEHGLADKKDKYRTWYIAESLKALETSIKNGVDIRGYMHWSFLDNFEWADGFSPRFGLVAVDYRQNGKRSIRTSAKWYAHFIEHQRKIRKEKEKNNHSLS
jgi:beta-glucosidase